MKIAMKNKVINMSQQFGILSSFTSLVSVMFAQNIFNYWFGNIEIQSFSKGINSVSAMKTLNGTSSLRNGFNLLGINKEMTGNSIKKKNQTVSLSQTQQQEHQMWNTAMPAMEYIR